MAIHKILVCETCLAENGVAAGRDFVQALKAAMAQDEAFINADVQTSACMSMCAEPVSVGFRAEGKAVYLFAGIDPARDLEDTLAFTKLYLESPDGWIEDARTAGRLRFCLKGRLPS